MLKGKAILTADFQLEKRKLEIRINIQKNVLRVGSLPDYESVVTVDNPDKIDKATSYRFFFSGLNPKTKMILTKLEEVSEFDSMM